MPYNFKVMLRTQFKNENEQRALTPKVWCLELWFLCTALFLNDMYLLMKCQVSSLNTLGVMLRTKFKNENNQRAITPKVWCLELCFLCIARLLNEIYLPMKFPVDALHSFEVKLRTKKGRTDGRTSRLLYDGWHKNNNCFHLVTYGGRHDCFRLRKHPSSYSHWIWIDFKLKLAMPIQCELRRLFHLMNFQTHRNSTPKALILSAYYNSWLRS